MKKKDVAAALAAGGAVLGGAYLLVRGGQPSPLLPGGKLAVSVTGQTEYPGVVDVNLSVKNTSNEVRSYAVFVVIGYNDTVTGIGYWFGPAVGSDPGYYVDGLPACPDVQTSNEWLRNALTCTGLVNPGETVTLQRRLQLPQDYSVHDVIVDIRSKVDVTESGVYDRVYLKGVINKTLPSAQFTAAIKAVQVSADEVDITATVRNTNVPARLAILFGVGNKDMKVWYGPGTVQNPNGYYVDGLRPCVIDDRGNPWYDYAFVCAQMDSNPSGDPAKDVTLTRKINVGAMPPEIQAVLQDAVVAVFDGNDISRLLVQQFALNIAYVAAVGAAVQSLTALAIPTEPVSVQVSATIRNVGNTPYTFALFYAAGNNVLGVWYGPGYYGDGIAPCTVGNPTGSSWYDNAFICQTVQPNPQGDPALDVTVSRRISTANMGPADLANLKDALVQVAKREDITRVYVQRVATGVIQL